LWEEVGCSAGPKRVIDLAGIHAKTGGLEFLQLQLRFPSPLLEGENDILNPSIMASNPAAEIGSILQSASIKRHPSPTHDLNPSTAASQKQPVTISDDDVFDADEDDIPVSALRPVPRRATLPPLPDLRFEQSYLKSIEQAEGWGAVTYITVRDQVCTIVWSGIYIWRLTRGSRSFCLWCKVSAGHWWFLGGDIGIAHLSSQVQHWEGEYESGGGVSTTGSCRTQKMPEPTEWPAM
jgi:hypothetical protein